MFGLFKNNEEELPIDEETRFWLDSCFIWLKEAFGEENIKKRKILTPHYKDFPVKYNSSHQSVLETLKIVAIQMEINPDEIHLDIYSEGKTELDTGGLIGHRIFLNQVEGDKYSGGLYFGKQEDGKYHIAIEDKKLNSPEKLVATLAHELSHIKLLGENKLDRNNEELTDLTTIVFGLGIFNANAAFNVESGLGYWEWNKAGYLSQMEWGYALALYSYIREEDEPEWWSFLSRNVKSDLKKGMLFIKKHPELIMKDKE